MDRDTRAPYHVLVVDADPAIRHQLCSALALHGLHTAEADCGTAALSEVRRHFPDAVLLDTHIRFPDGLAFCPWLRAHPRADWVPVLMMSSFGDPQSVQRCYAAGATDFIDKPINLAAIYHRVETFLRTSDVFVRLEDTVAELDRHREQLQRLAYVDTLTGLPNRSALMQHLEAGLKICRQQRELLVVLFIDVDDFKQVNDTLGHAVGDGLLATLAARLRQALDELKGILPPIADCTSAHLDGNGSLVARLAGDEFTVMLRGLSSVQDAERFAESLVHIVNEPMIIDGHHLQVSPSIGLAAYPRDGKTSSVLLHRADQAMYATKRAGKNGFSLADPVADRAHESSADGVSVDRRGWPTSRRR